MNVGIFSDRLNDSQKRHLINAVEIINGVQNYFVLSKEVREIELPGDDQLNPEDARDFLAEKRDNVGLKVCITARPFLDLWFLHVDRLISIISVSDWETTYAPPSVRCYLTHQFAKSLLAFASDISEDMILRLVHEPARGCVADLCIYKPDIKLGMVSGNLCPDCRAALLRYGTSPESLDAVERVLEYVRAEAIGKRILTEPDRAFVVMRFTQNDENDNAYRYGIKPGLEIVGIQVDRADNVVSSSQILDKVRKYIDRCRFIVAKVDEDNLNVYFELGLAMGLGKEVLLISEHGMILNLPSDLKGWECLTYTKGDYKGLSEEVARFFEDNYHFERVQSRSTSASSGSPL